MQIWLRIALATLVPTLATSTPAQALHSASVSVRFDAMHIGKIMASGYADPFTKRRLTANDPVRIASISKLAVALGVMRLVEAGKLDLDQDVSERLGWRLRNPAYPDTPITLRLLLSHQSSITDGIDYALPLGMSLEAALADPAAWESAHRPGAWFHYSNLNFPVIASIMEAASGERFDQLMARLVFTPLKLDACFNWTTCSDRAVKHPVVLTDANGKVRRDRLEGKRPACPVVPKADGSCDLSAYVPGSNGALFSPQGGMRISARDLAKIGQMLARRGRGFLSPKSIEEMVKPAWQYDGSNGESEAGFFCTYGLAVQTIATDKDGCRDDPVGDGVRRVGHAGEAYGLRSGLWFDSVTGKGMAFFSTSVPDEAPKGRSSFTASEEAQLQGLRSPLRK